VFLVVLTLIFSIRSKTADLVLTLLLFGGQLALGISALTHMHIHYDRDGQMRFRHDRPKRGILAWWVHWMADE
jgi:hypothetical protein